MRIRRLGLSRYGMFTDHTISFGERISGNPDPPYCLRRERSWEVYSFVGLPRPPVRDRITEPYSFLHGYPAMRIEGDLEIGGQTHRLVRIRKRTASLINGAWTASRRWRDCQRAQWHRSKRIQNHVLAR